MPRRKAATPIMVKADTRLSNCKAIDPILDLGNELKNQTLEDALAETRAALSKYNGFLADADAQLNVFNQKEKILRDVNERMLEAVGVKFGKDSNEYEKAGGVRKSERKRSASKPKP